MEISIKEVKTKKDLKEFIYLPEKIHKDHINWIPSIYMDDWEFFDPKRNKSFDHCDTVLILALKEDKVVGRCMGVIHNDYNKAHDEKDGRFSFIETYDDFEVFEAMINYITDWAKAKGMNRIIGPLAFSDKDPQGFLFEGYDEPHVIASNCNFPYLTDFIIKMGYSKKVDLWSYKIDIPEKYPPIYEKVAERFERNNKNLRIVEFKSRLQFRPIIKPVLTLINETFGGIYGFTPFSEKEMHDYANRYIILLHPAFIKVVYNEKNELIGNVIGMPDYGLGLQKCRGRLLPFGIFKVFKYGVKSGRLITLLGSIRPDYQGRGIDVAMGIKMMNSAKKHKLNVIDSHLGLEYNDKRNAEMERMGGKVYKKYRIYQKEI